MTCSENKTDLLAIVTAFQSFGGAVMTLMLGMRSQKAPHLLSCLAVTSRTVIRLFLELIWFNFVPVFHRLQGRPTAQG
jgi:hypothetical protein